MTSLLPSIQQKEVSAATTLLNSMCVAVPVLTAPKLGYSDFLCIPKEGAKMQHCNAWTSYTSNFNIKGIPQWMIKYNPR
jgi:hypothetical protein